MVTLRTQTKLIHGAIIEVGMLELFDMSMVDRAVYRNSSSASEEDLKIRFSSPLDRRTGKIRAWGEMAPGEIHIPFLSRPNIREFCIFPISTISLPEKCASCNLKRTSGCLNSRAHVSSAPETRRGIQTTSI